MKCKACGMEFDNEELYFCTGCGAMLRNPVDGKTENENKEREQFHDSEAEQNESVKDETEASAEEKSSESEEIKLPSEPETPFVLDAVNDEPIREEAAKEETAPIPPLYEPNENVMEDVTSEPFEAQPIIKDDPKKPVKVGALRLTGAAIVSFISFIVLIVTSILASLYLGISPDRIGKSVEKMNAITFVNAKFDLSSIADNLYFETDFDKATHNNVDRSEFAMYLSRTNFMSFVGEKARVYSDYIINGGDNEPTISDSEIVEFFMSNDDVAKEVFDYEMIVADYNSIRKSLADHGTSDKFSISKISWNIQFRLENVKYILSGITIGIFGGLLLVLLIWIALIVNRNGRHLLGFYGNIFVWGGLVTFLFGLAASAGTALAYVTTNEFVFYICSVLLIPTAVYAACIGAIVFIVGFILKKVKKSIKIKAKRKDAVEKAISEAQLNFQ